MKKTLFSLLLVVLVCFVSVRAEAVTYKFTPIGYPGSFWTQANDIYGGMILGYYQDPDSLLVRGFIHDGTNFVKTFDYNDCNCTDTLAWGIDGVDIVGSYFDYFNLHWHGFFYEGSTTWIGPLDYFDEHSNPQETFPEDIENKNIVGTVSVYIDPFHGFEYHAFHYFDGIWTLLYPSPPGPCSYSYASGIHLGYIVGNYCDDCLQTHGFLYDIRTQTYTTLPDFPGAVSTWHNKTDVTHTVGRYTSADARVHGFVYDRINSQWTTLDYPGAEDTLAFGISGANIVGRYEYTDANGHHVYGFLATPVTDPSEQMGLILQFFDQSVSKGTLIGNGPGKSANNRLKAVENMLEAARELIKEGSIAEACHQLMDAYQKTDGNPKPPDFVAGSAAPELASMIQDLRASLGCQ